MVHDPNTRGGLQGICKEEEGPHTNKEDHAYRIKVMGDDGEKDEGDFKTKVWVQLKGVWRRSGNWYPGKH